MPNFDLSLMKVFNYKQLIADFQFQNSLLLIKYNKYDLYTPNNSFSQDNGDWTPGGVWVP